MSGPGLLLLLNGALAFAGWRLRTVTGAGAGAGFGVGAVVALTLGWPGYLALCLYFALGAGATRLGWRRKRDRGIAEARGGARGARQVAANGGPPALFAVAAALLPGDGAAPPPPASSGRSPPGRPTPSRPRSGSPWEVGSGAFRTSPPLPRGLRAE